MKLKNNKYHIILLMFGFLFSQNVENIGFVSSIAGSCFVENVELNRSLVPLTGNSIFNHDIISSNKDSYCEILFEDSATKIHLDENTKIKFITDKFSRVIKLFSGSAYVKNAKTNIKTYVQTKSNDIFIYNNSVWVQSNERFDKIVGINSSVDIYNQLTKVNIEIIPLRVYSIFYNGEIEVDDNYIEIPDYVKEDRYLLEKKINSQDVPVFLNYGDMIPIYGVPAVKDIQDDNGFSYRVNAKTRYMDSEAYLGVGFYPQYKYNNLYLSAKINIFVDSEKNLYNNWTAVNDIIEKFHLRYVRTDYKNSLSVYAGYIPNVTFGHGYLVNNLSNSLEYPLRNDAGFRIDYKLDNDFMTFNFFSPSLRDYFHQGGILGFHTSLFLSHRFPLTLGFGIIADLNQFSQAARIYKGVSSSDLDNLEKRQVTAAEFDFNLNIVNTMDLEISLFGEFVGIWYPHNMYYMRFEGSNAQIILGDDKRWRRGTWGIMAPGISLKFDNKNEVRIALNFNSAGFYPSYFNSNYLYNKSVYFRTDVPLGFQTLDDISLLNEQIEMLNEFSIDTDEVEFLFPKEIYPLLYNKFSTSPVIGFTFEYKYNFRNKAEISGLLSRYTQRATVDPSYVYYTIEGKISIADNLLKNISNIDFYLSDIFFIGTNDVQEFVLGMNMGIKLPFSMSLIFDLTQVYYDSNLDGNKNEMMNVGINFGIDL